MIDGVDHIGIAVHSIEEARIFYESLGLTVTEIEDVPQEKVRVAMIPCGATRIELLEPTADTSPIASFLEKRGPGIHHICLGTGDIHYVDETLRASGAQLLREQPSLGAGGATVQFVHPRSTGGVLLEISSGGHGSKSGAGD